MNARPYAEHALTLWDKGWHGLLPLPYGQKEPPPRGYTGAAGAWPSYADVHAWVDGPEGDGNIGIRLPHNVIGLDVDAYDGKWGAVTFARLLATYGPLPDTWRVSSRDDGLSGIYLYSIPEGLGWPGEVGANLEVIQHRHRYMVGPGSVHPTGATYCVYRHVNGDVLPDQPMPSGTDLPRLPDGWVRGVTGGVAEQHHDRGDLEDSQVRERLRAMTTGTPCGAVRTVLARTVEGLSRAAPGSRHETARPAVLSLVGMGLRGHVGAVGALSSLERVFLSAVTSGAGARAPEAAAAEWQRLVRGAAAMAVSSPAPGQATQPLADPCDMLAGIVLPQDIPAALQAAHEDAERTSVVPRDPFGPEPRGLSTSVDRPVDRAPDTDDDASGTADEWAVEVDPEHVRYYMHRIAAQTEARRRLALADFTASFEFPETHDLDTLVAQGFPEVLWLARDVLWVGANVLLTAQFKTGKTTFVNNLIAALLDGRPFLGAFKIEVPDRNIMLLNYEMEGSQAVRWLSDMKIAAGQRLRIGNFRGKSMPLSNPLVRERVIDRLIETETTTLVVDPFARALGDGLDENSNTDVKAFTDALDEVKDRAGVQELVLVAHTGRMLHEIGAERARGATRLDDWADVRWLLTRGTGEDEGTRFFRATGRDVEVPEGPLTWDPLMRQVTWSDSGGRRERGTRPKAPPVGVLQDAIVRVVMAQPGVRKGALHPALNGIGVHAGGNVVSAAAQALVSQGVVVLGPRGIGLYMPGAAQASEGETP